ncbi:hypothetical protein BYT27DRAFT_7216768 [Phlegmacium glaucopus]|nr:hypothetical protein BYT27DRAFT_7216768 [Phlegmacium glaucopus]
MAPHMRYTSQPQTTNNPPKMVTFTSHDDPERMPAFPDSSPILPALPPFPKSANVPPFPDSPLVGPLPESADSAEVPPFPDSPPISPICNSVSMPPFPKSFTILASASSPCPMFWELNLDNDAALPNFPGLASDPDSTFPPFPMPDPNPFGVPNYPDHDNISMPAFPTVPPFPELAIKALPKASKSKKRVYGDLPLMADLLARGKRKECHPGHLHRKGQSRHMQKSRSRDKTSADWVIPTRWILPISRYPTFPELQNAHEQIRPPNASSIPYSVRYAAALKAVEDHLDRIEFIEDQAFVTGYTLESIQSNIQGWLISWDQ